jgi:tetratricopeptide (TPR) repeat protein
MEAKRKPGISSDRTLNRLIVGSILVLVIGIPLVGVIYFLDRWVDPGPTMVQRQVAAGEEAVRKEPNKVSTRVQLAAVYVESDRLDDAIKQYNEVLAVQPDHRLALIGRGKVLRDMGDVDGALKDFQKLVDIAAAGEFANADQLLQEAYFNIARIALDKGQPSSAIEPLEAALRIDRSDADAWALLGTARLQTGDAKQAVEALRRALQFVPTGWCDPYAQLVEAYAALGKPAGSAYASGMLDLCEQRPDQAKAKLAALASGPFAIDAALGLAMIAETEGDTSGAVALYRKVLTADPQNFSAQAGLGRLGGSPPATLQPSPEPASSPVAGGAG